MEGPLNRLCLWNGRSSDEKGIFPVLMLFFAMCCVVLLNHLRALKSVPQPLSACECASCELYLFSPDLPPLLPGLAFSC